MDRPAIAYGAPGPEDETQDGYTGELALGIARLETRKLCHFIGTIGIKLIWNETCCTCVEYI